ncbi:MAG: hypothetical protein WBN13_07840 [Robiginitalea sp.]|uniref:hypothetical protein n=1 Tax=Robiginitalea sp. TaxID=1902411 RepID=UPI003C7213FA
MATHFGNKWLILGIDMFTIAVSFFLAYLIRFNLTINFDMSKLAVQIPVVVLIALIAFLIAGSYKGVSGLAFIQDLNTILIAIGLWSILIIALVVINQKWEIYPEFGIPLSIIIINSLLSFVGLSASRYIFKVLYQAPGTNDLK